MLAGLPANRLYPLQTVQNTAAHVVTGARRRDLTSRHSKDLHWRSIYRIDFKIAVLTWRCLNGCAPSYIDATLAVVSSVLLLLLLLSLILLIRILLGVF